MLKIKIIDQAHLPKLINDWPFSLPSDLPCKYIEFPKPEATDNKLKYLIKLWRTIEKEYASNVYQVWVILNNNAQRIEWIKLNTFTDLDELTLVVLFL